MVERLGDVVVGAELEALDLVDRAVAGGEHHDRHVGELADPLEHPVAVQVGQADVQQHQVGALLLDEVDGAFAFAGPDDVDLSPLQREAEPDRLHDVWLVVHDQDLHSSPSSAGPCAGTRSAKSAAPARFGLDVDGPAVRFGDRQRDREPESRAGPARVARRREEPLEESCPVLGRDARPTVLDAPDDVVAVDGQRQPDGGARRRELDARSTAGSAGPVRAADGRRTPRSGRRAREGRAAARGPGAGWPAPMPASRARPTPSKRRAWSVSVPDRKRARSSTSVTRRCMRSALRAIRSRSCARAASSGRMPGSRRRPTEVRTAVRGVRSSWAMVDSRSVRRRSSASS